MRPHSGASSSGGTRLINKAHAVELIAMLSFRKSTILSPRLALGGARTMASAGVMPRQARAAPAAPLFPAILQNQALKNSRGGLRNFAPT